MVNNYISNITAFEIAAKQLVNAPTVYKNYYVHPIIVELYKENK